MTNAIARLRTIGIAKQPTFGVPAPSATYVLPLLNAPVFNPNIGKAMNESALGSAYQLNDMVRTNRFTEVPLEFKIDEDQLPLLLRQRFSIASVTVSGETVAYAHTLSYQNTTQNWYTVFLQDDNRADYIVSNALFDNLDFTMDSDFLRATANLVGSYPTNSAVTNAITQPKEFVGRMVSFTSDDVPGTATATSVLSMTVSMDYGINSEDTRFNLGNQDLAALELTADKFMANVNRLKPDVTFYEDHESLTMKQFVVTAEDTSRFVSPTSTRPSIAMTVPRAKMENYNEEVDLNELVREVFDLTFLKPVGVTGSPVSIVITNSVSGY